jgi:ClpP class serine protease
MIKSIVLNIDSPGGAVTGINELSAAVFAARGIKPVVAYVGGMMASAAYWVGSGASQIVMDATAIAGSIGVRMSVQVQSPDPKVTTHEIISSASPDKVQDVSTDAGRASAQRIVDDLASVFVGAVANHRGVSAEKVLADFGKGGVMVGAAAVAAGLANQSNKETQYDYPHG